MSAKAATAPAALPENPRVGGQRTLDRWFGIATLVAVWWVALDHLRVEWSINEQYSYGWMVPWLALYLFALRWKIRPAAGQPKHEVATLWFLAFLGIAWLPTRLLQISSPDWRLIGWALTSLAVVFTLGATYLRGGRPWLLHFFFPIAFTLVAVPWPVPFEQSVIQSLTRIVAGTSVEAMRWCGFPAMQQGNIIRLGAMGSVEMEEACSGVRSMQTMVMTALFLGEIWHKGLLRRLVLLVLGLVLAFVFNFGRAFTLSWLTAHRGASFADIWHSRVGVLFVVLTLLSFGLLAYVFRNKRADSDTDRVEMELGSVRSVSWRWNAALLGWLTLAWVSAEFWYRSAEHDALKSELVIEWPESEPGFRELKIPARTGVILRHDEGRCAMWEKDDEVWTMVYLRWRAGSAAVQLARAHTPDICLPAAGRRLESDRGIIVAPAGDLTISAHSYTFTAQGWPVHVFYIRLGDDAGSNRLPVDIEELNFRNRIKAALERRRNRGQQVVEVAVTTNKPAEEVTRAFKQFTRAAFKISDANS